MTKQGVQNCINLMAQYITVLNGQIAKCDGSEESWTSLATQANLIKQEAERFARLAKEPRS
jgi:hypothetical protein